MSKLQLFEKPAHKLAHDAIKKDKKSENSIKSQDSIDVDKEKVETSIKKGSRKKFSTKIVDFLVTIGILLYLFHYF